MTWHVAPHRVLTGDGLGDLHCLRLAWSQTPCSLSSDDQVVYQIGIAVRDEQNNISRRRF